MVDLEWIYKQELKEIDKDIKKLKAVYELGEITEGQFKEVLYILENERKKILQNLGWF